jgi:hypothetical protein
MTFQKTIVNVSKKIVGSNVHVSFGFDVASHVSPCIEISKGDNLACCPIYFSDFEFIVNDKPLLQKIIKSQNSDRAVFQYESVHIIFFKSKKSRKTRVKLINMRSQYLGCVNEHRKNYLILSCDDCNSIFKHTLTIKNMIRKHERLVAHFKADFQKQSDFMSEMFGSTRKNRECIFDYCKSIEIVNAFKVSDKKFDEIIIRYKQILPHVVLMMLYNDVL